MITITRGITNHIILTLTEKVTLSNPVFLFECIDDQTRQAYRFIAADSSAFSYRYNEFYITEQNSPDPLAGQVSLPAPGSYHYFVYQQASATNLDPALAAGLLETGKLIVLSDPSDHYARYDAAPQTNIIYQ